MSGLLIASVLITLMYFLSGLEKIGGFAAVSAGFAAKLSLPLLAKLVILLVIILELVAPAIIVGFSLTEDKRWKQPAKLSCLALAAFTVLATLLYHFPPTGANYRSFLSNAAATGGLVLLAMNM